MRLTPSQHTAIRTASVEAFGDTAKVWLFGSRVDDSNDVDLPIGAITRKQGVPL
jgi:hypothetical protein